MGIAEKIQIMVDNTQRAYDAGKQAEYERFWNNVPDGICRYTFAGGAWNVETFRPNKRITVRSGHPQYAFARHNFYSAPYDMTEQLAKYGGSLDISAAQNGDFLFYQANISRLPTLNMSQFQRYNNTFNGCSSLVTIDELTISPSATFTNTFTGCTSLVNLTISGEIGKSVNFQDCPLSVESMKSIIFHLKNYVDTEEANTQTLTFSDDCWERLQVSGGPEEAPTMDWKLYVAEMYRWLV